MNVAKICHQLFRHILATNTHTCNYSLTLTLNIMLQNIPNVMYNLRKVAPDGGLI